jgi:hypothetical protein
VCVGGPATRPARGDLASAVKNLTCAHLDLNQHLHFSHPTFLTPLVMIPIPCRIFWTCPCKFRKRLFTIHLKTHHFENSAKYATFRNPPRATRGSEAPIAPHDPDPGPPGQGASKGGQGEWWF